jgi:hypothetical protein
MLQTRQQIMQQRSADATDKQEKGETVHKSKRMQERPTTSRDLRRIQSVESDSEELLPESRKVQKVVC